MTTTRENRVISFAHAACGVHIIILMGTPHVATAVE